MWENQVVVVVAVCTDELTKEINLEALYNQGLVPTIYVPKKDLNNPVLLERIPNLTGVFLVMGTLIQ